MLTRYVLLDLNSFTSTAQSSTVLICPKSMFNVLLHMTNYLLCWYCRSTQLTEFITSISKLLKFRYPHGTDIWILHWAANKAILGKVGHQWGELIVSRYVAESITTDAGCFGHVGLCQMCTKLKTLQCETSLIANTLWSLPSWCNGWSFGHEQAIPSVRLSEHRQAVKRGDP